MSRSLRRGAVAAALALATLASLLGCRRLSPTSDGGADARADAADARAPIDAHLPETEFVYLEAGAEPGGGHAPRPADSLPIVPIVGLPRPCKDRVLGTVTFTQSEDKVLVTTSSGKARATCVRLDEHKLLCDWFDAKGTSTGTRKGVTYGPNTKIGGAYDAKHTFACPAQK